jgi:hypothetical protein
MTEPEARVSEVFPVAPAPERYRYRGLAGEFEFDAWSAKAGGQTLERDGRIVEAVDVKTIRLVGGADPSAGEKTQLAAALADHYRRAGTPFELHHLSGEIEDESGQRRPGFRGGGLDGRLDHSDGWSFVDEFLTVGHPDAASFPPLVTIHEPEGTATLRRRIEVAGGVRRRIVETETLAWVGSRQGTPMADVDRHRILDHVRAAYEHLGAAYRFE